LALSTPCKNSSSDRLIGNDIAAVDIDIRLAQAAFIAVGGMQQDVAVELPASPFLVS